MRTTWGHAQTGHGTSAHHDAGSRPRVAIVTGGSGCTGRQMVQRLAAGGHAVVADELDVERLFSETVRAFGGVDVVVHAASGPYECIGGDDLAARAPVSAVAYLLSVDGRGVTGHVIEVPDADG